VDADEEGADPGDGHPERHGAGADGGDGADFVTPLSAFWLIQNLPLDVCGDMSYRSARTNGEPADFVARRRRNREPDIAMAVAQLVGLLVFCAMFSPPVRQFLLCLPRFPKLGCISGFPWCQQGFGKRVVVAIEGDKSR